MTPVPVHGEPARTDLAEAERRYRERIDRRQTPWGEDALILLREYDRQRAVVHAAEAYVEHDRSKDSYEGGWGAWIVQRVALFDALADALAAARTPEVPGDAR